MYLQLQGSGLLDIRPLSEPEIREYMHYYFNGYQSDFLTDVYATNAMSVPAITMSEL